MVSIKHVTDSFFVKFMGGKSINFPEGRNEVRKRNETDIFNSNDLCSNKY